MSKFERLLEAGSTELPDCRCTAEMNLTAIKPLAGGDTEIRIFRCPQCSHELRLTAWRSDVPIIAIRYIHPSQTQKTRRHLGFAHADQPFHSPKTIVSLVEAK